MEVVTRPRPLPAPAPSLLLLDPAAPRKRSCSSVACAESATVGARGGGASPDECGSVAALLPDLKRMRLRPSLGQLRLRGEASDANAFWPHVHIRVEPELLAVTVAIPACSSRDGSNVGVQLQLNFPPQYPYVPPTICLVSPEERIPCWQYEGRVVLLERLTDRCWSSAMGVADIVRDLMQAAGRANPCGSNGGQLGMGVRFPPVPLPLSRSTADDEEME
eukprot:NODE_19121_length_859_cov_3.382514.p1 GENE.NODE_19121_length_859_cov_3.382514~~NODE_19121_length_859_cov_3.382514.p1  ORF type:complete len:220 (+),score=37.81 NODE_19121_length_859_cov_3.382514:98-757(+)